VLILMKIHQNSEYVFTVDRQKANIS